MKTRLAVSLFALAVFLVPAVTQQARATEPAQTVVAQAAEVPPEITNFIQGRKGAKQLSDAELQDRIAKAQQYLATPDLPPKTKTVLGNILANAQKEQTARQQGGGQQQTQQAQPDTQQPAKKAMPIGTQVPDDVAAYIKDNRTLKDMSAADLAQQVKTGRGFMQDKSLSPQTRQQVAKKLQAARAELQSRQQGQGATQDNGGTQQGNGTAQGAGQQPPAGAPASADATAYLQDNRAPSSLDQADLAQQMKIGRTLLQSNALPQQTRQRVAQRQKLLRAEFLARQQGKTPGAGNGETAGGNGLPPGQPPKPPGKGDPASEAKAQVILNATVQPQAMPLPQLRQRLAGMRTLLQSNRLSPPTDKALRMKLQAEREILRSRMAMQPGGNGLPPPGQPPKPAGKDTTVNIQIILNDTRPPNALKDYELQRRIDAYRDAVADARYDAAQRARWQQQMTMDRQFMRTRLLDERRQRQAALRNGGINIHLGMNFQPGGPPPPPDVFAAEVDGNELEQVLIAPPRRPIDRRYTIQEVEQNPQLRDVMPSVDIDTIHFGFGEAFVREEEVEKLDQIAEVMEKILTAHPREVFLIEGYTDAVGSPESNLDLSRRRAEAVKQALTTFYVIPPQNLQTVGYGEQYLKIPTSDPEAENRRVAIERATPLVGELPQ